MKQLTADKVWVEDLKVGMYVSALDRPWLETPFLLQGFYIRSQDDIDILQQHCQFVYIDVATASREPPNRTLIQFARNNHEKLKRLFPDIRLSTYQDRRSWQREMPKAVHAVASLTSSIQDVIAGFRHQATLDVSRLSKSIDPVIESVVRNPDACLWLARIKTVDDYTYKHCLGSAIWAIALGRQIGLPASELKVLALGSLLCDIGKIRIPEAILKKKSRLDKDEFEIIKSHVDASLEHLRMLNDVPPAVTDIVANHHERYDGSGYPRGLKGSRIPIYARIAAIADCYDAITSDRSYAKALSPCEAVRKLYEWRNRDFQAELVEEFIQAIGIYPAGTLVELSDGRVGVVLAEYRTRRLRPQVILLLDENKQPLAEQTTLDLLEQEHDAHGKPLDIKTALEPGAYGLTAAQIDYRSWTR